MECRKANEPVLNYSDQAIEALATYLQDLVANNTSLLDIFSMSDGRVFFSQPDKTGDVPPDKARVYSQLDKLFNQPQAINFLVSMLANWNELIDVSSIVQLRVRLSNFFLTPLQDSQTFKALLNPLDQTEQKAFYQQLLGAIVFKFIASIKQKFQSVDTILLAKQKLLTQLINTAEEPEQVLSKLTNNKLKEFNESLTFIVSTLSAKTSKEQSIIQSLFQTLSSTQTNANFSRLKGMQEHIWHYFQQFLVAIWLKQTPEFDFLEMDLKARQIDIDSLNADKQTLKLFFSCSLAAILKHLKQYPPKTQSEVNVIANLAGYLKTRLHKHKKAVSLHKQINSSLKQTSRLLLTHDTTAQYRFFQPAHSAPIHTGFAQESRQRSSSLLQKRSAPELTPRHNND